MSAEQNHNINFIKMSGAGNDFVIFDARKTTILLAPEQIKKISDRRNIGCDQLILIKNADNADCLMEIYNSDGSLSGACGNATRCVASILFAENETDKVKIQTSFETLNCWREKGLDGENLISVDMGIPNFDWEKIPLAQSTDSQKISLLNFEFACVNVGNPHAVTFVSKKISDPEFFAIGPQVENNQIFPEKTNVEFAHILADNLIEVRVWERGAGETLACGTGACAVAILAIKKNLTSSKKIITRFQGGDLLIEWNGQGSSVIMTGGYQKIFSGTIDASFFK